MSARQERIDRRAPVRAVLFLTLTGLLTLVEAERFWIGYVPTC